MKICFCGYNEDVLRKLANYLFWFLAIEGLLNSVKKKKKGGEGKKEVIF